MGPLDLHVSCLWITLVVLGEVLPLVLRGTRLPCLLRVSPFLNWFQCSDFYRLDPKLGPRQSEVRV